MAVLRELTTLISFKIQGLAEAEGGVQRIKRQLEESGVAGERAGQRIHRGMERANEGAMRLREGLRGLVEVLALSLGIREFAEATNQWAAMSATVENATKSQDEFIRSRQRLIDISHSSRVGFEGPAQLFANFKAAQGDTGETNDQIFGNIETITKALAIGHRSADANQRAIRQLDEMIGNGKIQTRHLQALRADSQTLARALELAAGGPTQLQAFMKGPDNNIKGIIGLLNKMGPVIGQQFKSLPLTFGNAMQTIRNDIEVVLGKLFVDTGEIANALQPVVDAFDWLVSATDAAAKALGGYKNLATAVSIAVLSFLSAAIARTAVWAAELALVELPWILLAGAIAAVGLEIQDIWTWSKGGDSLIGRLIGPYSEWKPTIDRVKADLLTVWGYILEAARAARDMFVNAWKDPTFRHDVRQLGHDLKIAGEMMLWLAWTVGRPIAKFALKGMLGLFLTDLRTGIFLVQELTDAFTGLLHTGIPGMFLGGPKGDQGADDRQPDPNTQAGGGPSWWRRALGALSMVPVAPFAGILPSIMPQIAPGSLVPKSGAGGNTIFNQTNQLGGVTVTAPGGNSSTVAAAASSGVSTAFDRISEKSTAIRLFQFAPGAEFGTVTA